MKKFVTTAAAAFLVSAFASSPAAAHPDNGIKAPGQCDQIPDWQWNKVRKGMTLDAVEKIVGCHATHIMTREMSSGVVDQYSFQTGSKKLATFKLKNKTVWNKYANHSNK